MPKISASTVAEHRAQVQCRLVDAAEAILRSDNPEQLTAGSVTKAVGIARNSIYRYVASVDDLRGLVLARYLPTWLEAVSKAVANVPDPKERIVAWVRSNLEQAAASGHGWLMGMGRMTPSTATQEMMDEAHAVMRVVLAEAWADLITDQQAAQVASALTRGVLEAGFKQLDEHVSAELVIASGERAAHGLVAALASDPDS